MSNNQVFGDILVNIIAHTIILLKSTILNPECYFHILNITFVNFYNNKSEF